MSSSPRVRGTCDGFLLVAVHEHGYHIVDVHTRSARWSMATSSKSFSMMLPYFMRYDHYNYARWGPVYLAEMHQLPAAVHSEFEKWQLCCQAFSTGVQPGRS